MVEHGPRTRVDTNDPQDYTVTLPGTQYSHGVGVAIDEYYVVPGTSQTRYMADVVTENFKRRIAAGEIINNPMHSIVTTDVTSPGEYKRELLFRESDGTISGNVFDGPRPRTFIDSDFIAAIEPDELESMLDKAVTQAYGNRSLVVQAVSMTLAEGRKTIQGIYEILLRVLRIAKAAKRLDLKYLLDEISPSELKDRYMELRYAIRPLVIDAENVIKAVNANMGIVRKTARGGDEHRNVLSDFSTVTFSGGQTDTTKTTVSDISVRSGILCGISMNQANVWGIDQFAETIWEVVPFSFIINWFVDVASLISSWTPKAGVTELASWYSYVITSTQHVDSHTYFSEDTSSTYNESYFLSWKGQRDKVTVEKRRLPNPKRSYWPSIDVSLDALKILDLGIILKGVVSGKITKFMK